MSARKTADRIVAALAAAVCEKDVENAYRAAITRARPGAVVTSPHNTDGFVEWAGVRLLLEVKHDVDLTARADVCAVLGQCLLYVARFDRAGPPIPNVIMIADVNECLVLPVAALRGFLDLPGVDWSAPPSTGCAELTRALMAGLNLLPHVYAVGKRFDFAAVLVKAEELAQGEGGRHARR